MTFLETLGTIAITAGSIFFVLGSLAIELTSRRLVLPNHFKSLVIFTTIDFLTVGAISIGLLYATDYLFLGFQALSVMSFVLTVFIILGLGIMAYLVYLLLNLIQG